MKKVKLLMIGLLAMTVVACGSSDKTSIELKKKEFVIEYGDAASEDAKDYIKADKDVLKETGISFKDVKYEKREADGKEIKYLEVGSYKATAVYKDETLDFKIVVKDTTAPEFVDFKEKIEIEQDSAEDLSTKFTATDLSDVTITVDVEKIDSSKAGEYKTTVTAKDKYDNEATKDVTIVVKEKASADQDKDQQGNQGTQPDANQTTGGFTGSSTNSSGGTSAGNGSGGSTTPSNPTPAPTEAVVQLTPTPTGSPIFETEDEAINWAYSIWDSPTASAKLAEDHGYTMITNWYNGVIHFGYASTGQVVYSKHVIIFTFQ
ncbi:hypothetical protein [Breznakia pachnodae]|uniref:DUF5011 domain-containing protein n=1 Tax=Breznakia pachnodae TaxID=265178 RepID=A0ABU0E8L3_9FIRM|nr:hypothetical protein [Breznakia pachnodae]MDQ0363239.1 hypothetical protein [Breznakia pachnodae]